MKTKRLMLVWPAAVALQCAYAQTTHLKLSEAYPAAGKSVTLTYDPAGTLLESKGRPDGMVYYLDNKDFPVSDLTFVKQSGVYKATTLVPAAAKAFVVKVFKDDDVDNNNGEGYLYKIYTGTQPVAGADAGIAYMLFSGMGNAVAKITTNNDKALELYKEEFALHPESSKEYKNMYVAALLGSKNKDMQAMALQKTTAMAASGNEKDMMNAVYAYKRLNKTTQADSLMAVVKQKFPDGDWAKNEIGMAFNKEKDPVKKEEKYQAYIQKYPAQPGETNMVQDNFKMQIANAYLAAGKMDKFNEWAAQVKNKNMLAMALNNTAYNRAQKDTALAEDEKLSKLSLDMMKEQIAHPEALSYISQGQAKQYAQNSYDLYADTYAYILYKEHKYAEALPYEKAVYEHSKGNDADITENYTNILVASGKYAETQKVAEEAMKAGKSNAAVEGNLKQAYIKVKGSDKGYDEYLSALRDAKQDKMRADLAKEMISQPAPQFTLKDFNGTPVSLNSLKGKVVVVDFWATWCGPCKASFPGMQMAVNKYKDDPSVKFLFIDTWENGDHYEEGAKKFIADNKYTFNVLMDEKGDDGRQSKVVSQFKVEGIPTKFVIDQTGKIRFKHVGFSGTNQGVVDDISAMIEMLKHQSIAAVQVGK